MHKRFEAFVWKYFHGKVIESVIPEFHKELMTFIDFNRVAIAAPRYFSKSTYFSFLYPLFAALKKERSKILLVSATGALAEDWLRRIRLELESNESLRSWYGDQVGEVWRSDEIILKRTGSQIWAKGAEKQIRGFHPNIIILDDVETEEQVQNPELLKRMIKWFNTDLLGTIRPDDQIIAIGTLLHPESFLADLINNPRPEWKTKLYRATEDWKRSLWPQVWPISSLRRKKAEIGEYAFEQEFQNNPIPDELRVFQKEWIQYFEKEPDGCSYFTTVDPATSDNSTSDFTAIVTCAVDRDFNMYVVDTIARHMLPRETIQMIFETYQKYRPSIIGIESIGFQKMLKYEFQNQCRDKGLFPKVEELKPDGRRKHLRIQALQPRFEGKKIFLKKNQEELISELLRFPSARSKDDCIDALAYQLEIIRPGMKQKAPELNPESFMGTYNRIKRSSVAPIVWGNGNLRNRYA